MPGIKNLKPTRYTLIDMYRGLALFGLLMVHLMDRFAVWPTVQESSAISSAIHLAFAGKAYATLALCFGINFSLLVASAKRKGVSPVQDQIWRYGTLFLFGVANTLLFGGDVLQVIAVLAGLLIILDRIKDNTRLFIVGLVFLAQPIIIATLFAGIVAPEFTSMYLVPDATALQSAKLATQEIYKHGSFWDVISTNLTTGNGLKWWHQFASGRMFKSLGLFILGVYLGRTGFLSDPIGYLMARRWPIIAMLCVLPVTAVTKAMFSERVAGELSAALTMMKTLSSSYFSLFALGAMLVVITWAYQKLPHRLFKPLETAGRMTLTLYITQSIVFVPIFYGFGMGGYAFITSAQAFVMGIAFFIAQLIFAHLWLQRHEYGPLEWLWRQVIQTRSRRSQSKSAKEMAERSAEKRATRKAAERPLDADLTQNEGMDLVSGRPQKRPSRVL